VIGGLEPYPAYKDSGMEWLGAVPEGWSILPLTAGYRTALQRNTGNLERTVLSLSYGRIVVKPDHKLHGLVPESLETYQCVFPGDIIVRSTDLQNDQTSLRVGAVKTKGVITSAYLRLIPRESLVSQFAYLVLHAYDLMKVIYGYGSGLRQTLDFNQLKRLPVAFPPASDQRAIVSLFNYVDVRIERLITAKEQLVGLLQEEKRAIIQEAVVNGLDSCAPRKESGLPWIGDMPAHWSLTRVKNEFRSLDHVRRPLSATERELRSGPYDYYGASGVIDKVDSYLFDEDLLLIAEDGANLVLRNLPLAIVARGRYWVNNHAHILKPRSGRLDFMALLMESLDYRPYISGAAQPKLTKDRLLAVPIAVPPVSEQEEIVRHVGSMTTSIDQTLVTARRQIRLMNEFRTRLIADVVTGKLDVRKASANIPGDPDIDDPALEERLEEVAAG
jgi:type I restriction enzyme S subunit